MYTFDYGTPFIKWDGGTTTTLNFDYSYEPYETGGPGVVVRKVTGLHMMPPLSENPIEVVH